MSARKGWPTAISGYFLEPHLFAEGHVSSNNQKKYCRTSGHCLVHAFVNILIPIHRKLCHSVSDFGGDALLRQGLQVEPIPFAQGNCVGLGSSFFLPF